MPYKLQPGCTVGDSSGVARNNVSAFWQQTWWRILFATTKDALQEIVTLRTPHNLLSQREVKRHQVVVDTSTGEIVGYARWVMPSTHEAEWIEAQTPKVSDADMMRLEHLFKINRLPTAKYEISMDGLDDPIEEKQRELAPPGPFLKLDYLATRPDHQRRGISGILIKSGLDQADRLGIPVMVLAMGDVATNLYKKFGFKLQWDLEQSLKPWGQDDVYYTAILIRDPPDRG